ncbi:MAG TPA: hypothetical protein VIT45_14110 [Allosphingosinicella sp.]
MRLFAIALGISLSACATDAVRPTASATMRLTQGMKAEMSAFAERQNAEIDGRHQAIAILRQNAQLSAARGAKQRMDWRSSDQEDAIRLFAEATNPANSPGMVAILSQDPATAFPASAVALDRKQYDALLKALKPLGAKGSPLRDTKFLIAFGQSVVAAMEKDVDEAAAADEQAGSLAPPKADPNDDERGVDR